MIVGIQGAPGNTPQTFFHRCSYQCAEDEATQLILIAWDMSLTPEHACYSKCIFTNLGLVADDGTFDVDTLAKTLAKLAPEVDVSIIPRNVNDPAFQAMVNEVVFRHRNILAAVYRHEEAIKN